MERSWTIRNKFGQLFSGRRGRDLREYLTAYLMISPSIFLIFLFGIFPVGFALYVSLHKWRLLRDDFLGIEQYIKAIDNLTYILMFGIGIGALLAAYTLYRKIQALAEETGERPWLLAIPGALYAATTLALIRWVFLQLPEILDTAEDIIGKEKTRELFLGLLKEAFQAESVVPAARLLLWLGLASIIVGYIGYRLWSKPENIPYQINFALTWLAFAIGAFLLWTTFNEISSAYQVSIETGEEPQIWSQIIPIISGLILLIFSWKIWRSSENQDSNRGFWVRIFAALTLMVSSWLLIGVIPAVISSGDVDLWRGLKVTVYYSIGTVPFQLTFSLFLAILLFQKLRGSEMFRILFFLPYVTPAVASAAVFRQIFSNRLQAPINALLRYFNMEGQQWLREPDGVFTMLANNLGVTIPDWAGGPSMALAVIMIFSIWTFVGYDIVIYLAGLGNIPTDLIESAEIDGAGKWQVFRHITFPLLSPTTYFLSLIAIIGTFKAFNHIWILTLGEALHTTETFSVVIFKEFFEKTRYGYASALAFVLFAVILSLTYVNNKIQGSRVFYG